MRQIAMVGAGGLSCSAALSLCESFADSLSKSFAGSSSKSFAGSSSKSFAGSSPKINSKLLVYVFDDDRIELSNLNRQILFCHDDIGQFKAEVFAARLNELTTARWDNAVSFVPILHKLTKDNIETGLKDCQFVIEGSDCVKTKLLLNDFCAKSGIGSTIAGVTGQAGFVLVSPRNIMGGDVKMPLCLRCVFGNDFFDDSGKVNTTFSSCQSSGIFGPAAGIVGAILGNVGLFSTPKLIYLSSDLKVKSLDPVAAAE